MLPKQINCYLLTTLLSILPSVLVFAQNQRIEALQALLPSIQNDTVLIDTWNDLSYEYYPVDIIKSDYYSQLAYEKSQELGYQRGLVHALNNIATSYGIKNELQQSLELNLQVLKMARELNDSLLIGKTLNDLGVTYTGINLPKQALGMHMEARPYLKGSDIAVEVYNIENLAYALQQLGDEENASIFESQVAELAATISDPHLSYYPDYFRAYDHELAGQLDSALYYYQQALDKSIAPYHSSFLYECVSTNYYLQEKLDSSIHYAKLALDVLEASGNADGLLLGATHYCSLLHEAGDHQKSLHVLDRYLNTSAAGHRNWNELEYAYELQAEAYSALGQLTNANACLEQQMAMKDSLRQQQEADIKAALQMQYELRQQEEEINALREQQEQSNLIVEQKSQVNLFMGLALVLLAAVLLLMFRVYRINRGFRLRLEQEIDSQTARLRAANQQLQLSNAELERFAYVTSHDLREPLRNIAGFSTLISRRLKGGASNLSMIEEYLNFIRNNTIQMDELIREILEYSRLENIQTVAENRSVNKIVDEVRDVLHVTLDERQAKVIAHDLPAITTYPKQLFLVLKNLIENGIKYNQQAQPEVHIHYEQKEQRHYFYISDNGIGIDQNFRDQIFELFARLHSRSEYDGTGIGLAACKKILNKLEGAIWLADSSSQGSTFAFYIPVIAEPEVTERPLATIAV
ncbi:MAG: ATP-binding protein [Bacteroidota bacterium]